MQSVLIEDCSQADLGTPHYLRQYSYSNVPIVALNCSAGPRQAETCHLDGVTMIGASRIEGTVKPGPAIRVFRGWVNDATILNSALTGPRPPPEPQSGSGAHAADVHDGTPRRGEALLKA